MTFRLTGRSIVLILVLFFGAIFIVNAVFIVQAIETFRGEDEQNPYLQGIDFNKTLAERAEQAELGWKATLSVARDANGLVDVTVTMRDRLGAPVERVALVGELRHPSDSARDRTLKLKSVGEGVYKAVLGGVASGVWDVLVRTGNPRDIPFEARRRLWLR